MVGTVNRLSVLMVTGYLPFAAVSGGRSRTLGLLRALRHNVDVTLACLARPAEEAADRSSLDGLCDTVIVPRSESPSLLTAALMSLTSLQPITAQLYRSPTLRVRLGRALVERHFDLIHVESFYMLQNIPFDGRPPVLLVDSAIESVVWARHARSSTPAWRRPGFAFEAAKIRRAERRAWRAADAVGVVSPVDEAALRRLLPDHPVMLTPNGVDTDRFVPGEPSRSPASGVFTADYKYFPNVDAVIWFVRSVLPSIRARHPDFVFRIVGKDAPPAVRRLAGPGVDVVGAVDDVRPYLQEATVFVCPLRSGSGTRTKLLEALACGCPVVTTPVGAEGLGLAQGREAVFADDAAGLADGVAGLIDQPAAAATMGRMGRDFVATRHSWSASAERHLRAYEEVCRYPARPDARRRS